MAGSGRDGGCPAPGPILEPGLAGGMKGRGVHVRESEQSHWVGDQSIHRCLLLPAPAFALPHMPLLGPCRSKGGAWLDLALVVFDRS
eukprot:234517-Chlamydomonas_euryale.AAC.4